MFWSTFWMMHNMVVQQNSDYVLNSKINYVDQGLFWFRSTSSFFSFFSVVIVSQTSNWTLQQNKNRDDQKHDNIFVQGRTNMYLVFLGILQESKIGGILSLKNICGGPKIFEKSNFSLKKYHKQFLEPRIWSILAF